MKCAMATDEHAVMEGNCYHFNPEDASSRRASWSPAAFLRLFQKNSLLKMDLKNAISALEKNYWTFSLNFLYTKMLKALKVAKVSVYISHVVYLKVQSNQKSLVTSSDSHRNAWSCGLSPDIRYLVSHSNVFCFSQTNLFIAAGLRSRGLGTCLALLILNLLVKHLIR